MKKQAGRVALTGLVVVLLGLTGCATGQGKATQDATALYNKGQFEEAKEAALTEMRQAKDEQRQRAALTAGLSAHAMGNFREAEHLLGPLTGSRDREIAGLAGTTLGLIAQAEGKHERAAGLLITASRKLSGDDAARAALHAGDSLAKLGRKGQARVQYTIALASAQDRALKQTIEQLLGKGQYTVQVGAFHVRQNAQRKARQIENKAKRLDIGDPRIVRGRDAGRQFIYLVRIGRFGTQEEARQAREKLGGEGLVTPAEER